VFSSHWYLSAVLLHLHYHSLLRGPPPPPQHPDLAAANTQMQQAVTDAQKDFEEKSANMNDQEKSDYYQQTQQRLQQKQQELIEPIQDKVKDAVKSVAEAKGLTVVLDKSSVVYGGQDITQDVAKKVSK